jgi:hypothetical protein
MRVQVKTTCEADVYETWELEVPDLASEELRDAALEALWEGDAELIEDDHSGERNRQIIGLVVLRQ